MVIFLDRTAVQQIHGYLVRAFGGASDLHAAGLLESAIEQPRASFGGELLHPDLASQAAAYLYHLYLNQPFVDGNKRVALGAALVFIELNHHRCSASTQELKDLTMAVASGTVDKPKVAAFFRKHGLGQAARGNGPGKGQG